jgi:predicted amino acid dehydrogenase
MKFAFLAHPLSQEHRALMAVDKSGRLRQSWGGDIFQFCQLLHQNMNSYQATGLVNEDEVRVVDEFSGLVSGQGKVCDGRFYEIPMDAQQILEQPNHALALMEQAVDDAAEWGAEIVGLGSMTGIVGSHGQHLAERGPVAVTTGNSLTVYSATQNLKRACELTGIELRNETVAVVGIPGSIGMALAKLLAPLCKSLICVARTDSVRARNLAASLDSQLSTSIPEALKSAKIVMSATSSGDCIDQNWLMPGSLVIDVAVPTDVIGSQAIRDDILILTGGMLMTPKTMSRESKFIGFNHGMVPSCFGETMTLALEDRRECFSIGKNLSIEGITEIGAIANGHGFDFSNLSCFGVPVSSQQITRFQKSVYRNQRITQVAAPHYSTTQPTPDGPHANGHANGHATNGHATNGQAKKGHAKKGAGSGHEHYIAQRPEDLSELAIDRYKRFVNPVLVALGVES